MTSDCSVRLRTLAVFSAILCICCFEVISIDGLVDADFVGEAQNPSDFGTADNPYHLPSGALVTTIEEFDNAYGHLYDGEIEYYFSFDSGSFVDFGNPGFELFEPPFFTIDDPGPLSENEETGLYGIADGDFAIGLWDTEGNNISLVFIAVEPELGSEQNPYTGEATIPLIDGGEAWVEVGTYVQFDTGRYSYGFDGFQGSGLMNVGHALYGTVTTLGDYEIQYGSAGASDVPVYDYVFTLHVVGDVMLEFLSDPTSDGILIPPNHHLVRFIGSDGVLIGYDIVEHGGFMQLPEGHESDLWSESADLSSGLFDTTQPVESDLSLYVSTSPSATQGYEIHIVDSGDGTTTVDPAVAQYGRTVTITMTPDEGSTIRSLNVVDADGNQIETDKLDSNTYTFRMPRSDVFVHSSYGTNHNGGTN